MMKKNLTMLLALGLTAAAAVGCGDATEEPGENAANNGPGGKADENDGPAPCTVVSEEGAQLDLSQRNDVIANTVLKSGEGCPTTFAEIMDKLRKTDADDSSCKVDNVEGGISSMIVSERAQLLQKSEGMRVVVTRQCNGRDRHDLFFSLFGVSNGRDLPGDVEVMSFDKAAGVYNYYALEGGQWTWFGTSLDLIQPGAADRKRCAGCHTGGGPIMKELDTPWNHWEGHEDVPGASELVDKNEDLGSKSSGSTMESLAKSGNRAWNPTRVKALVAGRDLHQLLRPLACTVEVNLDNGADFRSSTMSRVPFDFLLDPVFKGFGGVNVSEEDYQAHLEALDQRMVDGRGNDIKDAQDKLIRDTIFRYIFPERAFGDMNYVEELKKAGAIDDNFIKDFLIIDFARPIYSEARCGLIESLPETIEGDMTVENIRNAIIAKLEGAAEGTVEAELLANLKNAEDDAAHTAKVDTFVNACNARDKKAFMEDALMLAFQRRAQAREHHERVFEFPETMPVAGMEVGASAGLDPVTCELVE